MKEHEDHTGESLEASRKTQCMKEAVGESHLVRKKLEHHDTECGIIPRDSIYHATLLSKATSLIRRRLVLCGDLNLPLFQFPSALPVPALILLVWPWL